MFHQPLLPRARLVWGWGPWGSRAAPALSYLSHMETVASAAHPRITIDPNVCHGQPTVRGLRYPVQNVLEYLASGMTEAEILADYPDLEADDLRACQAYAADVLQVRSIYRLAS